MTHWLRFEYNGAIGFGTLEADMINVYQGDMFSQPTPTGQRLALDAVRLQIPSQPSKLIGLWNNYHALAEKLGQAIPPEPLYFIKAANSYLPHDGVIRKPIGYEGKVVYEGELGIVIGKTCTHADTAEAQACIFGYTCINDVTALDIISRDASFAQWARAKSCDTFGIFGPVIATGLDPQTLSVKTLLNGKERQHYPCSDMIFAPAQIVSRISQDLTLYPGDVIACGTSLGVGPLRPGNVVEISIEGIGILRNNFEERAT